MLFHLPWLGSIVLPWAGHRNGALECRYAIRRLLPRVQDARLWWARETKRNCLQDETGFNSRSVFSRGGLCCLKLVTGSFWVEVHVS